MINLDFNRVPKVKEIFNLNEAIGKFQDEARSIGLDIQSAKITDEIIRVPLIGK